MKKNIGTQEAYVRITISIFALLLALFVFDGPVGKILFATLAAILAGTAFLRTCPINKLIGRDTHDEENTLIASPTQTEDTSETSTGVTDEESFSEEIPPETEGEK